MLGEPALVAGDGRGDPQRVALLAQQRVAAVAGAVAPDLPRPRGSARCTWSCCTATATSCWPGSSGAPTECRQGTKSSPAGPSNSGSTAAPIRVMICIDATTYSESVISTPSIGVSAVERAHAERDDVHRPAAHAPAVQLGHRSPSSPPARTSCWWRRRRTPSTEQMKVRSSTRATSSGSDAAQNEFGFFCRRAGRTCPPRPGGRSSGPTPRREPSHHTIRSGVVSSATSRTQDSRRAFSVGASSIPGTVAAVISGCLLPGRALWPDLGNADAHPSRDGRVSRWVGVPETVPAALTHLYGPQLSAHSQDR